MNRRSLLQITALAGVSLSLTGCGSELIADYNQKIRVTVITPEGEKSGSAVTHIETRLGAGKMTQSTIKGEATVVDLGQGKYLFALLSENTQRLSHIVFPDNQGKGQDPKEIPQGKVAKGVEPYSVFPLLVTFDDLNDPKSVKEVNPANLAATFGAGYSHKSTTLEITNEPVTEGVVEKLLPWLFTVHTRLISTNKKYAKDFLPIENIGPEYFITPFRQKDN